MIGLLKSLYMAVDLQEDHLLRPDLDFALVPQPYVLVPISKAFSVDFDEILLAETSHLPSLDFEVIENESVLS